MSALRFDCGSAGASPYHPSLGIWKRRSPKLSVAAAVAPGARALRKMAGGAPFHTLPSVIGAGTESRTGHLGRHCFERRAFFAGPFSASGSVLLEPVSDFGFQVGFRAGLHAAAVSNSPLRTGARVPKLRPVFTRLLVPALRRRAATVRLALLLVASPALAPASAAEPPTNQFAWTLALGHWPLPRTDSSAAVAPDGTVYIGCMDGRLYAVTSDGVLQWEFRTGRDVRSSPAIAADGTIYFGSRDRHLYAVTPQGRLKWRLLTGWWVDASPAIGSDGTIYCGSWDRKVYAVTPDGREKWSFATGGPVFSSAAIGRDGTIYVGSNDGQFRALTPEGRLRWALTTGGPILASPAIGADDTIYFTSTDGKLYAVGTDGRLRWQLATGGWTESSPAVDAQGRIFVCADRSVWAVSAEGKKLWESKAPGYTTTSSPALTADWRVYVACRNANFYAIAPDGEAVRIWEQFLETPNSSPNLLADGAIVVGCGGYSIFAIRATNALATSSWPMFRGNRRHTGNVADHR